MKPNFLLLKQLFLPQIYVRNVHKTYFKHLSSNFSLWDIRCGFINPGKTRSTRDDDNSVKIWTLTQSQLSCWTTIFPKPWAVRQHDIYAVYLSEYTAIGHLILYKTFTSILSSLLLVLSVVSFRNFSVIWAATMKSTISSTVAFSPIKTKKEVT